MKTLVALLSLVSVGVAHADAWTPPLKLTYAFTEASTDMIVFATSDGTVYAPGCIANAWIFNGTTADCVFRRWRPGNPRDGGHLFRRMAAGVSQGDETLVDVKVGVNRRGRRACACAWNRL
jgi:hypothetical protein